MKVTIQVIIERDNEPPIVNEIARLERATLTPDTLGLMLTEAKTVLAQLQDVVVREQAAAYVVQQQTCPHCGAQRRCKGHHQLVVRSLFGKLRCPVPGSTPAPVRPTPPNGVAVPWLSCSPSAPPLNCVPRSQVGGAVTVRRGRERALRGLATAGQPYDGVSAPAAGGGTPGRRAR